MKRLTIFPLDTVIRYSEARVRALLFEILDRDFQIEIKEDPAPDIQNFQHLTEFIFAEHGIELKGKSLAAIRKSLKKAIKGVYLDDEEAFEIRPGVQSLFRQLDKEARWKFGICSDFWPEATVFIMQSCGVNVKNKLTLTAEDARTLEKQIQILMDRNRDKEGQLPKAQLVCLKGKKPKYDSDLKIIHPKASDLESNYHVYPKFTELFKLKKAKSK